MNNSLMQTIVKILSGIFNALKDYFSTQAKKAAWLKRRKFYETKQNNRINLTNARRDELRKGDSEPPGTVPD